MEHIFLSGEDMADIDHSIWKSESVVAHYLDRKDSRPFIQEQIEIMLRLIKDLCRPVHRFIDLGSGDGILAAVILENYPTLRLSSQITLNLCLKPLERNSRARQDQLIFAPSIIAGRNGHRLSPCTLPSTSLFPVSPFIINRIHASGRYTRKSSTFWLQVACSSTWSMWLLRANGRLHYGIVFVSIRCTNSQFSVVRTNRGRLSKRSILSVPNDKRISSP